MMFSAASTFLIEHAVVAVHLQQFAHLFLGEAEHVIELGLQADVLANVEAADDGMRS